MQEEQKLLENSNFGERKHIILIFETLKTRKYFPKKELLNFCSLKSFYIRQSYSDILSLFSYLSFIEFDEEENVILKNEYKKKTTNNFIYTIIFSIFKKMNDQSFLDKIFNIQTIKYANNIYYYTNINCPYPAIRNLFISLGLFQRDKANTRQFNIVEDYRQWFKEKILPMIEFADLTKRFTLKQLKTRNEIQEKNGKLAEDWVFEFEKKRVAGHDYIHNIEIISENYCNAGYDIKSYNSIYSQTLDRLIEVKSYSSKNEEEYFYWSKNEIEVSKKKRENYYIYLVDRDSLTTADYTPNIIKNPYEFFLKNSNEWTKETISFKFSRLR